jgi:hypothetical protein
VGRALTDLIPLALGVALSPLPVLALLLMLMSRDELRNGRAFAAGWIGALVGVATASTLVGIHVRASDPPRAIRVAELVTGLILLLAAGIAWRRRRTALRAPRWLLAADAISPMGAFWLAIALAVFNAKDIALTVAAGTVISDAALTTAATAVALATFAAIAGSTVLVPFAVAELRGERALPSLRRWHGWLERHGRAGVALILAAAGVVFVASGLQGS